MPPVKFAARKPLAHPWPFAPLLELPGGALHNYGGGRVLSAQQFVLAVGLSPRYYAVVARAPGIGADRPVLEQAVGFLAGQGAQITRVNVRCPISWFQDTMGDFMWQRCVVFFARTYLVADPTDPPWIQPKVWPIIIMGVVADAGRVHWEKVEQLLEGVEAADPDLLFELGNTLTIMGRRWELYLARMILIWQRAGEFGSHERDSVAQCDHEFYRLMTHYEPAYEFLPTTVSRLL